ncbi:hypothetical protein D3C73_728200 [compost metagenome]
MNIQVQDEQIGLDTYGVEEIVELAPLKLPLENRVPSVQGDAFDLKSWYKAWALSHGKTGAPSPTHLKVEAVDEFQAVIPWDELDQALFLYAQAGAKLAKGYPIRLYVPDGSSECLNVKSVVKLWFLHDSGAAKEASYGFKNTISLEEITSNKRGLS